MLHLIIYDEFNARFIDIYISLLQISVVQRHQAHSELHRISEVFSSQAIVHFRLFSVYCLCSCPGLETNQAAAFAQNHSANSAHCTKSTHGTITLFRNCTRLINQIWTASSS